MNDSYLTIANEASTETRIEKSRFIGTAIPVATREEAELRYGKLCKEYYDATHNCFAYRVNMGDSAEFRYSDDGEPSGTAGKPIYDTIDSFSLTNVLVVVTRYFGGVKLGTGGLMRAYKESASQALSTAHKVKRFIKQRFLIRHAHEYTAVVMRILSEQHLKPLDTRYGELVELESEIRAGHYEGLAAELVERSHGKVRIERLGEPE